MLWCCVVLCCMAVLSSSSGMVNILHGLGLRLLVLGYHTPFVVRIWAWQGVMAWGCGMGVAGPDGLGVWHGVVGPDGWVCSMGVAGPDGLGVWHGCGRA